MKSKAINPDTVEITCVQSLFYFLLLITVIVTGYSFIHYKDMPNIYDFYNVHIAKQPSVQKCSFEARASHLERACKELHGQSLFQEIFNNDTEKPNLRKMLSRFIFDDKHKVMFCYIAKVGSTTFKNTFIYSTEKYRTQYGNTQVAIRHVHTRWPIYGLRKSFQYTTEELLHRVRTYHKVLAVRHPLARVHSFYKDKLKAKLPGKCKIYQQHLGKSIVAELRNISKEDIKECQTGVQFDEFIKYFASHPRLLHDVHLKPYDNCYPCHIRYNQIIKLETGDTDQKDLIDNYLREGEGHDSVHMNYNNGTHEEELARRNFTNILEDFRNTSQRDYKVVKDYYARDHLLFGYSSELSSKAGLTARCLNGVYGECC